MKSKLSGRPIIILSLVFSCLGAALAQDDEPKTRSVQSPHFTRNRPERPRPQGTVVRKAVPRTYKYSKTVKAPRSSGPKLPGVTSKEQITDIGITMWRLRPPRDNEKGFLLPVTDETTGARKWWLSERVGIDEPFKIGDKIRLAVESSIAGYLYIIDRETYADGTFGPPEIVFPLDGDDNAIFPGMLFDFPDHRDDPAYIWFEERNKKDSPLTGDILTVIISPKPLTIFKAGEDRKLINDDKLVAMEADTTVEVFSRTDTADSIFTKAEADSTCGQKTRGIGVGKSASKPCGSSAKELYSDDAAPQALYRVKGSAGQPAVAFVKLTVRPGQ